jgi:hypothetical protein
MATGNAGMMKDRLAKAKMNKKTKEATQLGPAYEPTKTGIQFWDEVERELVKRKEAYEKALEDYKEAGGEAQVIDANLFELRYKGIIVRLHDDRGKVTRIEMDIPLTDETHEDEIMLANAMTAFYGSAKSETALSTAKDLKNYLENDGYIKGMNSMANQHILENPALTAMSFIPDENKRDTAQVKG